MTTKIIREMDNHGRITLGIGLMNLCSLKTGCVALCRIDEKQIMLKNINDAEKCTIIALAKLEKNSRIRLPKEVIQEATKFEIYVKDLNLIIEEAH